MLFDLQGKRRRVVVVVYAGLAFLMGGGLVLSGIGSDASGGLLDAFIGNESADEGDARKPFENQIKDADARLRTNPEDQAALSTLVRAHFGLAGLQQEEQDGIPVGYTEDGRKELQEADAAWTRFIATEPDRIDQGLAATALQIYDPLGLGPPTDKPEKYVLPAREIAEQQNTPEAYIKLVEVATVAGDTRTAGLAERKALSFAQSKDEEATLKERIETAKAASAQQGADGAAPTPSGP